MRLILEDVVKSFDKKTVLNGASASFETGKIYGLLGRNGAGKTTLFNCISKDCRIDGGSICLDKGEGPDAQYDSIDIGFVYSTPHLPDFMTGYEFIKFFIEINRERIQRIHPPDYYLDMVGIKAEDQHRLLKDYSHGMQNKVQMLSSIMTQPPVLLLDEPLTSFDVVAAHEMKELIIRLKSNSIIIFSTHILQLAQDLCDEIVLLHNRQLQPISSNDIHQPDFEEEIVALLSEEESEGKS